MSGEGFDWPAITQAVVAVALLVWAFVQADSAGRIRRGKAAAQVAAAIALIEASERALDAGLTGGQFPKEEAAKILLERGYLERTSEGLAALSVADFPTAMAITNLLHARTAHAIIQIDLKTMATTGGEPGGLSTSRAALTQSREKLEWQLMRLQRPMWTAVQDFLFNRFNVGRPPPEA